MATVSINSNRPITTSLIETSEYPIVDIKHSNKGVAINSILPFRIRLTSIKVPGYSATNFPGIDLQIIGLSNYIL